MTPQTLNKKVIEHINNSEDSVLVAVFKILKIYENGENTSIMTYDQKQEIEKRSPLYKQCKLKHHLGVR